ncbi:cytidine deaminase [Tamlana sp. 2_MG-2023]|uniref:cytidine deaminase n=1 Tax=unclassified Tamlana TaxID=2614803 RepID=UPI0026E426CE|nr:MULTISPECIES: cytidine deaminase [unclassified Tamlana]MDO6760904.1 cytidine deaminase [Tamlana sp. 2_MG-2023]MDO6791160.1 cytidine deaminase [Tamlana sp. 1_MG-2023]
MKEVKIESKLFVFDNLEELPRDIAGLMGKAIKARSRAYAPYSNFQVGAALLLDNGEIITGNNQENASYPSGLCAERTAIYYAGSQYPNAKVLYMAITATAKDNPTKEPIPPCGACRQAMVEYEIKQHAPIAIYFMGKIGAVAKSNSVSDLLPFVFDKSVLF